LWLRGQGKYFSYAYAQERPLEDVAGDVVGRRLRFDELGD
jgi:hypothetical protein